MKKFWKPLIILSILCACVAFTFTTFSSFTHTHAASSGCIPGVTADEVYLPGGFNLKPGEAVCWPATRNGVKENLRFIYQTDGNLVLYATVNNQTTAQWASHTQISSVNAGTTHPKDAIFQTDGNFVIYENDSARGTTVPVWATGTDVPPSVGGGLELDSGDM